MRKLRARHDRALPDDPALTGPNGWGASNVSKNGGAVGANARWTFDNKHVVFGVHFFAGEGVGRYGAANLSDLAIHANGNPDLIRNAQGLATLEWHGKKLDVYAYTGAEYDGRTTDFDPAINEYVGYGSPLFNNSDCYTETAPSISQRVGGIQPGFALKVHGGHASRHRRNGRFLLPLL